MPRSDRERLAKLGAGESIASLCNAEKISRTDFDAWWKKVAASRVPHESGSVQAAVHAQVQIVRDEWGIPHILADADADLFFGLGYAMAQDRLFQLDYLRRKAAGRLSEILGIDGLQFDVVARTVGLRRIAEAEWHRLPEETQGVLSAFSAGINALIDSSARNLPIEFDLLDYRPEPWSPIDCLAIEGEFRWYLTGRFPVIVMPELAKRALGDGPLYREFLLGEADDEAIMPPGSYPPAAERYEGVGQTVGEPDARTGSNNWVVSGRWTASGLPMVASDPHIAFEAVSCWYEAHLCGGSFNVAGMTYVGMPAIMFGRNERVAWGITNNICSQRDLYREKTDAQHPGCFFYDGHWEPSRELSETIHVRGRDPVTKVVRFSRNGPIVDEILPSPGDATGPVSLKWLGAYHGGWLTALLAMDRTATVDEFRKSLRPWHVPTFSLVIADVDGNIGFQTSGRIPVRKHAERGYRPGWDPEHQWAGLIPFSGMPGVTNPERGWMVTANNRLAASDYPYPLSGTWSSGYRAMRVRQMIEAGTALGRDDFRDMQQDALSLRAIECVPQLLDVLSTSSDGRIQKAAEILRAWDFQTEPDRIGQSIFTAFFVEWAKRVAAERFESSVAALLLFGIEPLAARLLRDDRAGWFVKERREAAIMAAFNAALDALTERLGADIQSWKWERLHRLPLKHVLGSRGDLAQLLNHGGAAVKGDAGTVCNTGLGPDWNAATGCGYRLLAELSSTPPRLWAIDGQSQSGHPGSRHYGDQFSQWVAGNYHAIPLDRAEVSQIAREILILLPN